MPEKSAGALAASRPEKKYPLPKISAPRAPRGTLYRGREGMWSWVLHRITGVSIFFFLLVHILDTSLVRVSPGAYNAVINSYKTPIMGLGETALVVAIGFHALNGLRVILIDFWSLGAKHQRLMFWIVIVVWVLLLVGFVPRQFMHIFGGA
ncbi:succinate dehydrogenase, cytochrome b556 subunit [Lacisediminihabitans profunda]|uniref:Succinate dehydrogenase, cytochrome b556 subunit n=1 Tax=Lacisediminihabitans profunda TaxID=2594790 RepID=A0A5C8UIX5_9MICO|nr:succinate dehydrogenase, cytochrome b556 subunit [Lacisediminihabitans profunda]